MVASRSGTTAAAARPLLPFLRDFTEQLEHLQARERLTELSPPTYRLIGKGLERIARDARHAGHATLAGRAEALAARLPGQPDEGRGLRAALRLQGCYARFAEEARRLLAVGAAEPPLRLVNPARHVVMVVDDEDLEAEIVARALAPEMQVIAAASVAEALTRLREKRPDMIIIDTRLGGASGADLLAWLQEDGTLSEVPMLMRSNHTGDGEVVAGLLRGAADYIPKSLSGEALKERCLDLLRSRRARLYGPCAAGGA